MLPEKYNLLCVGGGSFTEEERRLFSKLDMEKRIFHRQLSEPELFAAYKNAQALLFPSEAEGFGLPIIEAQSQNCIPVLSDIPCFKEIGADQALYFPLHDADMCAEQLNKIIYNEVQFSPQKNLSRFNWANAAQQTVDFYQKFI